MADLKRSTSTGSETPLLVAKEQMPITRRWFIRRALATANNIRHHPSVDSRTKSQLEDHHPFDEHHHSPTSCSNSSSSSDDISIYTSGSGQNVQELRPACEERERVVTRPSSAHPSDEDSVVMLLATQHCETPIPSVPDFTSREAVSEYEDPTFVPEESTVEESLAEPLGVVLGKMQPAPSQKPPVHPAKSSKMLGTDEDLSSVDEHFALGVQLLDQAKRLLSNKRRGEEALQMFRQAVLHFEPAITQQQASTSHRAVAGLLHSARCHRYMSSIVTDANDAVRLLHAVVRLYDVARERVELVVESNIIAEEAASIAVGCPASNATQICLDTIIIDSLRFQADVLIKRLGDYKQAIVCYEEILRQLMYLEEVQCWDGVLERSVLLDDINFVSMSKEKHTEVLREALSVLMGYFNTLLPLDESFSFVVYEDALNLLRMRQEENYSDDDEMIDSVASLYKQLSEIYVSRQESDRAVLALQDFAVVKLTASGEPCSEALQVIENMGKTYEQMENYSDALECYELALLSRCRYYGNTHVSVAKALVNVARMKELQDGNTDESVNLYRAANAIFSLHVKVGNETAENINQSTNALKVLPLNSKPLRSPSPSEVNSRNIELTTTATFKEKTSVLSTGSETNASFGENPGQSAGKGAASVAAESVPEEDESDDDSDVKLMKLPFQYVGCIQNDCDDVTVFSSDNDIVTLASSSNVTFSSRAAQSDIVSMDPGNIVSTEEESQHEKEKSLNRKVSPNNDGAANAKSSIPMPESKSRGFTKIFSLADTLKRMQKARHATQEKNKDPPLQPSTRSAGTNSPKQEFNTNNRGSIKGSVQEAPRSIRSNHANNLLNSPIRCAKLKWI